jgi:hypothetical protein
MYPYKYKKTFTEIPDEQMKRTKKEKIQTARQTSRLETPEELQLHYNHENFLN